MPATVSARPRPGPLPTAVTLRQTLAHGPALPPAQRLLHRRRPVLGQPALRLPGRRGPDRRRDAGVGAPVQPQRDDVRHRVGDGDARARPTCASSPPGHEMPFAGHPTLGTAAGRRGAGRWARRGRTCTMPAGRIPVGRVDGGWRLAAPTGDPARGDLERRRTSRDALGIDRTLVVRSDASLGRRRGRAAARAARRRRRRPGVRPGRAPDGRAHDLAGPRAPHVYVWAWTRAQDHRGPALLHPGPGGPRGPGHRVRVRQPRRAGSSPRAHGTSPSTSARAPPWAARRGCCSTSTTDGGVHVGGRVETVGRGTCSLGADGPDVAVWIGFLRAVNVGKRQVRMEAPA